MIDVDKVTFRYPGDDQPALQDVSVQVVAGETVGIVGPNGSGKSTLGRLIKGLLLPFEGHVRVDDLDSGAAGIDVRRMVGLVFQNPNSQIVNAVVEQEVAFGPENLGLAPSVIRERVTAALSAVGLLGRETSECHALSMADKQRVALASVIAMQPRYLVLDEPTAWLEPGARGRLLAEVFAWAAARRVGLVLITHRMDEAMLCRRLYGILDGHIIATGTPKEVLEDEAVRTRLALSLPDGYTLTLDLKAAGLPVVPGVSMELVAEALCQS